MVRRVYTPKFDVRAQWPTPHARQTLQTWSQLNKIKKEGSITIDGYSLDVSSVVAVARHGCSLHLTADTNIIDGITESVDTLNEYLDKGYALYGVNTGFGGSADARTTDVRGLQRALMQLTQSAILIDQDKSNQSSRHEYLESHSMPSAWTRAMILIRCNANIRGHSATTKETLDAMIAILRNDIVPIVPLRGSISASGDLMPLSYVSGTIQGSPDVFVRVGGSQGTPRIMTAEQALEQVGIQPIVLGPKEGLSLINGTAAAAAVATLGLHEANQLALFSQLLSALTSEALYACVEWAHPFIAATRPHSGQIEAAQNIRTFLRGSKLTYGLVDGEEKFKVGMSQERYSTRSAPQWLSPQLEDLMSAERQLTVELNSTSDNPIVNVADRDLHCGANFQAAAVTSATEKIRLGMQSIGKMLFSQTGEMINNHHNNGLPPNLAADDPSLSYCLKGIDINTAAYLSELGFLANPVSTHVQSAEMHNQAINSLGLLSARKTLEAIECLSMIVANCLYTGCQGVDLRTLHRTFLTQVKTPAKQLITSFLCHPSTADVIFARFWDLFERAWYDACALDAGPRCDKASETLATALVLCADDDVAAAVSVPRIAELQRAFSGFLLDAYLRHRDAYFQHPTAAEHLGQGTRIVYCFVRERLGVPMHRGLVEHPVAGDTAGNVIDGRPKKTIGSWVSLIYQAVRDGSLYADLFEFLEAEGCCAGAGSQDGKSASSNGQHT